MSRMTIQIPTYPLSPPESPSRQFGSPDWFKPSGKKTAAWPSGIIALNSPPLTPPPLSPISSEADSEEELPLPPPRPRLAHQTHRRTSAPTYFTDASSLGDLPKRPTQLYRARFPSMPVTGVITPMWNPEETSDESSDEESPDPFKMLLPFCKPKFSLPTYTFNEKHFVLAHVPTKRLNLSSFRPRVPRIPRWQRPVLMAVLCVMLFGSMCILSYFQQSALSAQRASIVRQTVWLAQASRELQDGLDAQPDLPAGPSHHSLKGQGRLAPRSSSDPILTAGQELAALMSFVTGTAANALPPLNPGESIDPDLLLPFDLRSAQAQSELDELVQTQWENFPIMVIGKLRDPKMHNLRHIMKTYNIRPTPVFVEHDTRPDAEILDAAFEGLLGKQDEPYVLLRGVNVDPAIVQQLGQDEAVVETFKATATVAKKLKRNKHQKEEERQEMDRILGPAPILDQ